MGGGGKIICWQKSIASELAQCDEKIIPIQAPSPKNKQRNDARTQQTQNESNRKMENLMKLAAKRDIDQNQIRDRCDKMRAVRSQRFDRLLDHVMAQDELKCAVTNILQEHEDEKEYMKMQRYNEWNDRIFAPMQKQIDEHMNPADRVTEQKLTGSKTVGFRIPGDTFRAKIAGDDPLKRALTSTAEEVAFRKAADFNCQMQKGMGRSSSAVELARSRPVLEPELWEQLKLQSTPYGHFAQVTENGGCTKTSLRTGGFVPDEGDGIPTAGKRRTRWERNNLGILADDTVSGEGRKYRTCEGGSSGALAQDHYRFERGTKVTDTEFPLGKRMFPHKH